MNLLPHLLALACFLPAVALSAIFDETFEDGEDTSDWGPGSDWVGGEQQAAFLSDDFGGEYSWGTAGSSTGFSREFRNNTSGVDIDQPYTITMYVQADLIDTASGGEFQILDGAFGNNNAANLRIALEEEGNPASPLIWQARDNNSGLWVDLGLNAQLATPYFIGLSIDPPNLEYSAVVQEVDVDGGVLASSTETGPFSTDPNVFINNGNGLFNFYLQSSSGETTAMVDNINITGIPEPAAPLLSAGGALLALLRRRRD